MRAILSDIHGNLEALEAVLEDAIRHGADGFYFLGDVVGYGPNPRECLDLVMHWEVALLGNFELAVLGEAEELGVNCASKSILFANAAINASIPNQQADEHRWAFLRSLPRTIREGPYLFVHGSARNPLNEYVFPEDIYIQRKMDRIFALVERYCFQGHTHVPGIFTENQPEPLYQFHSPQEIEYEHKLDSRKTLINVGSVGQPRDGDWRACYILLDGDVVRFRRVEYDIETTVRTIHQQPCLDKFLGDRLRDGR
jgi:diadenosine tetraphosphatase ApaH/serine/threonine PP2A family protein phosphatase